MAETAENQETEELTGPDLDETLATALRDIEARESPEETEETEESAEEAKPDEETKSDRERDEHGRFKAKETEETAETSESDETKEETKEEEVSSETPLRPPSSWSADGKAAFETLPENIKKEVLKREEDFHKGLDQYRENATIGQRLMQVIQPYQPYLRSKGTTPEQTVTSMLQTAYALENASAEEKPQLFLQVAQRFGVDLSKLETGQTEVDPKYQQLEQRLAQLQGQLQSQTQAAQQRTLSDAYSSIDGFRNEIDEQGRIKHLYFDDVRNEMADMIEANERQGKQLSLQDAYDAAIWARPDIRESLLTQQQQQKEEARKKEADRKAAEAKKRASVNVSITGSHTGEKPPKGSIDDTLRATYEDIQARKE